MQPDRCHGRFQFVGNRIDEAVVLLVATDFVHQEAGVDDHPRNDQEEKNYPKEKQHPFAPVKDDPANVQCYRQRHQAYA